MTDFQEILIDDNKDFVYIGGRNFLMKLSVVDNGLTLVDSANDFAVWKADRDAIEDCHDILLNSKDQKNNCQNFIRVLLFENNNAGNNLKTLNKKQSNRLLVCGTFANRPQCTWRNVSRLNDIIDIFDGIGKCPQSPETSSTYLQLNGDYYFATSIDYSNVDPDMRADYLIDRSLGNSKQLRSDQYNSNWLNDPKFVASLTIGDYIYFFIKETAIEFMNCGQTVYSRVVRLCKYDQGIENYDVWQSFEKARLNCSVPAKSGSKFPFGFEEIENVHFDSRRNLIYAIFTTPPNGVKGSAVCVYDVQALEKAFDGPFKHQKSQTSVWEPFYSETDKVKVIFISFFIFIIILV
jgi:semaphorin 5